MALMVTHGAIAGGMSPFGPGGVIVASQLRDRLDLPDAEWTIYFHNLFANTLAGFAGFVCVGTLVLSHFVPGGPMVADKTWLEGVRPHFSGRIIVAQDTVDPTSLTFNGETYGRTTRVGRGDIPHAPGK